MTESGECESGASESGVSKILSASESGEDG
jgi:hypothetical protein